MLAFHLLSRNTERNRPPTSPHGPSRCRAIRSSPGATMLVYASMLWLTFDYVSQ
jgi:hypothetical protein